ncbi:DUF4091 domain-containing protein [Enterococcus durans]|uniref:DUF4091 domain-containing protein n=1 Tax=Enterococcus durans TaxID=53345 RepID=UPI001883A304|nr:DUF4091 domain-containing protein [Enterococcus durans]MBE9887688.1 DUF4091 domain-containing protein [Enterococcus durans]
MKFMIVDESYKASTELSYEEPTQITTITSSKNSCAAFQLLLHDGKKNHFILNKQFSIPDEIEIPMYRIAIKSDLPYQAQFVDYYLGTDGLAYADKLIGETAYTYSGDRYAPIYIEIPIDKQVKPGTYPVQLSVYRSFINQEDQLVAEKSIEVSVLDFAFPDDVQQDFRLDIWQQPSNLARTFHVPLWGDAHFGLIDQMADKLAAIGQKAVTVIAGEIPWKGWFNYIVKDYPANLYEYSMIPIRKNMEGVLICDFSILDRYLACFEKYGINQEINLFGLLGVWKPPYFPLNELSGHSEKIVLRYFDESTDKIAFIEQAADFTAYLKQLVFHLKEIGVWERTYMTADEPKSHEVEAFIQAVNDLKAIEPSIQIKVAFDKESVLNSLESVIDYPVTSFYCTCNNQQQLLEKFGKKLNYYICNYPTKPNTFLHSPLLETRVQGLLAYYFKTDGLLRWALNCWPTNARTDIRYNTGALPIGDNCLIYPGYNGDLLLSLRYKQLLRGIEDFWLLKHAEEQNEKKVQQLLDEFLVVTDPKDWMLNSHQANPEAFQLTEEKYQQLRNALIRINQGE